ncbi:DUF3732 domain-containing protein [Streptomyces sp. NPDC056883]|uniref:DUF3732 domain-containing protein n=1 Tax=Streptomyces sp. NPDC056883 TaxID=3345959 RepID=UPI0036A4F515
MTVGYRLELTAHSEETPPPLLVPGEAVGRAAFPFRNRTDSWDKPRPRPTPRQDQRLPGPDQHHDGQRPPPASASRCRHCPATRPGPRRAARQRSHRRQLAHSLGYVSGKNHVGYHLAAHLALHQYFTANSRPVPRFLMLDQPTQPYYPSDMAKARGRLEDLALEEDRVTVTGLFQLMHQVVTELSPGFQIIVSDHADLPHPWYQEGPPPTPRPSTRRRRHRPRSTCTAWPPGCPSRWGPSRSRRGRATTGRTGAVC